MKELEEKLDEKFGSLTTSINHNTDLRYDATTNSLTNHSNHLHTLLGTIAQEFQQNNIRMQGIITGLSTAAPDVLQRSAPSPTPHGLHRMPHRFHFKPHRASKAIHQCIHKDHTHSMDSNHIAFHKWPPYLIICIYLFLYNKVSKLWLLPSKVSHIFCKFSCHPHNQSHKHTSTPPRTLTKTTHTNHHTYPNHLLSNNNPIPLPKSSHCPKRLAQYCLILLIWLNYLPTTKPIGHIYHTRHTKKKKKNSGPC